MDQGYIEEQDEEGEALRVGDGMAGVGRGGTGSDSDEEAETDASVMVKVHHIPFNIESDGVQVERAPEQGQ